MPAHRRTASLLRLVLVLLIAFGLAAFLATVRPAGARAASGRLIWTYTVDSIAHNSESLSCAKQAPGGTMYAAGDLNASSGATSDIGMFDFRQTPASGSPVLWSRIWDNVTEIRDDSVNDMTVDAKGDQIVAGGTDTTTRGPDWLIIKRSPKGLVKWLATYDGGHAGLDEWVNAVACDGAGNVYACGSSEVGTGQSELVVCKFRAGDGRLLWTYRDPGSATPQRDNEARAIVVDAAGNAYVTGSSDTLSGNGDAVLMKLDAKGRQVWMRRIHGSAGGENGGYDIALRDGALYVGGVIADANQTPDVLLARYATSGTRRWLRSWAGGPRSQATHANDLTLDGAGNPVIAGETWLGSGLHKGVVVSWTPGGRLRWGTTYWVDAPGLQYADLFSVVADAKGDVWAGGEANRAPGISDALLLRLRPDGKIKWTRFYDGAAHGNDRFSALALWGKSSLFAGGMTTTVAGGRDALAARFAR